LSLLEGKNFDRTKGWYLRTRKEKDVNKKRLRRLSPSWTGRADPFVTYSSMLRGERRGSNSNGNHKHDFLTVDPMMADDDVSATFHEINCETITQRAYEIFIERSEPDALVSVFALVVIILFAILVTCFGGSSWVW